MSTVPSVVDELIRHCLGAACPTRDLLNTGAFAPGWVARYLEILNRANAEHGNIPTWPRELTAAVYVVSVYCPRRYRDWQQTTGMTNPDTEGELRQIRWAGDEVLLGWFWRDDQAGHLAFTDQMLAAAHLATSNHRELMLKSALCGCCFCLRVFQASELGTGVGSWRDPQGNPVPLRAWTDDGNTGICPYCACDCLIPEEAGFPLTNDFLGAMNRKYFSDKDAGNRDAAVC